MNPADHRSVNGQPGSWEESRTGRPVDHRHNRHDAARRHSLIGFTTMAADHLTEAPPPLASANLQYGDRATDQSASAHTINLRAKQERERV